MLPSNCVVVSPEVARSLKTLVIASKSTDNRTYTPPSRTLAAILPDSLTQGFPGFLFEEFFPTEQQSIFYRIEDFESAAKAYFDPLPR